MPVTQIAHLPYWGILMNNIYQSIFENSLYPNTHIINRYISFINHCKSLHFTGYTETHHIIPKSFNGNNSTSNLIRLSARHHYIAHLLLAKATGSHKMIKALHKMIFSTTGDVKRNYKISSRVYAYIRENHARIVSQYSKNTVVARQIYTNETKRIPKSLFDKYNSVLYVANSKGRKDSPETIFKKQLASQKPRIVKQKTEIRRIAASLYSFYTPKGFCQTSKDLFIHYPSFTNNTLTVIKNDAIITKKFASIHNEFIPHVGKSFEEYGIIKIKRNECQKSK